MEPSQDVLEFKSLTAEEQAAQEAAEAQQIALLEEKRLTANADRLRKMAGLYDGIPPEIILADAIAQHTAALNRAADAHEHLTAEVARIGDLYRDSVEVGARGTK